MNRRTQQEMGNLKYSNLYVCECKTLLFSFTETLPTFFPIYTVSDAWSDLSNKGFKITTFI